jgi:hypothetical protein
MSKAPIGNSWGGWARSGAPGRAYMDSPWQVEPRDRPLEEGEEAEFRVSDARVKRFTEMTCQDTSWITSWHWDARRDIDPPKQNKFRLGTPNEAFTSTCDDSVYRLAAGKPSNLLQLYDQVAEGRAMTPMPLTAR